MSVYPLWGAALPQACLFRYPFYCVFCRKPESLCKLHREKRSATTSCSLGQTSQQLFHTAAGETESDLGAVELSCHIRLCLYILWDHAVFSLPLRFQQHTCASEMDSYAVQCSTETAEGRAEGQPARQFTKSGSFGSRGQRSELLFQPLPRTSAEELRPETQPPAVLHISAQA